MPPRRILFVHSPLVGPSSLRLLADAAKASGCIVSTPDLSTSVLTSDPHDAYVSAVLADANRSSSPITVVGHSGAGAFLPAIGHGTRAEAHLIFVDAVLPPPNGVHRTPPAMAALLDDQTDDGILRPWLTWWPDETVAKLLPDPDDRELLGADMPRLPRSFYDVDVAVPAGWSEGPCAYLRLSEAYDAELVEARSRGWPTATCDTTHLGVHTDADRVHRCIVELDDELR